MKTAWIKFFFDGEGGKKGRNLARGLRIDTDYAPKGAGGAFPPVMVTYCWDELDGDKRAEKIHEKKIETPACEYSITVGGTKEPLMKWIKISH